jgi:glycosyltransferase involved in cell wall biosynthesis
MQGHPRVSVATCLLNEEEVLPELLRRVTTVLDSLPGGPHEMVIVDDGSSDRTFAIVAAASERDPRIVGISFSRNFGHQAALSAALEHASGDVVILVDGDLQDTMRPCLRYFVARPRCQLRSTNVQRRFAANMQTVTGGTATR